MRHFLAALMLLYGASSDPTVALAQSLEGVKRPEGEAKPVGYLTKGRIDHRLFIGPPPAPDTLLDRLDMLASRRFQAEIPAIADERWQTAERDHEMVYPRFAEAFGRPIDRQTSPHLVRLLNRVMRDVSDPVFRAKEAFQRPRPYQRYQLSRRCGGKPIPTPDKEARGGSSYPSGHTAYGWATALVLADIAPDRAPLILERGRDYALSRVICGYHFPSDTEAARAVVAAVVMKLHDNADYSADLAAARTEYEGLLLTAPPPAN
ncbi:MAG: phosphatase PAP2 family protein [Sphingopyxis sp.]|uniref:acid phosphatase n=1 Tax=Sphingopyxis sp. TaxID=1908224 RepID=UPI002AB99508|nr:phosphatase PAP2 family protein [Sphingopyxis sp.]MDZ3831876.1 phosphatase PAP2 family protein [Sphingopyxis sp.]